MNPTAAGGSLIWSSLTGAMPALAPGTLIHLGLVGLLSTYRHSIFAGSADAQVGRNMGVLNPNTARDAEKWPRCRI